MGASLIFIPAGHMVSSGVALLWTVNACFAIVQVGGASGRQGLLSRWLGRCCGP